MVISLTEIIISFKKGEDAVDNLFESLNASRMYPKTKKPVISSFEIGGTRYGVLDCTHDANSIIKYINNDRPVKYGMKKAVWFARKVKAI